jgi:K(+)-stimulated pyrophosphate-energized sodium pump
MSEASLALPHFRARSGRRVAVLLLTAVVFALVGGITPLASAATPGAPTPGHASGGEANLKVPDLGQVNFSGINGRTLLLWGLVVCALGLLFG